MHQINLISHLGVKLLTSQQR